MTRLCLTAASAAILLALIALAAGVAARLDIPPSDIIFSHARHVTEQEIDCAACHDLTASSTRSEDRNLPTMDKCADCHDVEDDQECGRCHRNPDEPQAPPSPERTILFNHKKHLDDGVACSTCHGDVGATETLTADRNMPSMAVCMGCHSKAPETSDCRRCHADAVTLTDIHPEGWRHKHAERASVDPDWCNSCHQNEVFCLDCHRGDNLTGNIHDLNYRFTHGLDAQGKEADCSRCHERRLFCNGCHELDNRMPLAHSTIRWQTEHGQAARADAENCASCHDSDDPTCGRVGCHNDSDGMRGTDPRFHPPDVGRFNAHGPWHGDEDYFCFSCHVSTGRPGVGFCGYCHGGD